MTIEHGHGRRRETSSDKALSVMDLFTPERPEWTVEGACAALGQSESTVYRYFRSLSAAGLVFTIRPGRYLLGPGIVHYDRQRRISDPLLRAAQPAILGLAADFSGPGAIFISRIYRDHVMAMHEHLLGAVSLGEGVFARGRLAPLFSGAPGLAILAFLELRTVRAMFRKTGGNDADWREIKRRLREIRAAGYAASADPDAGVVHVSAPLKQEDGGIAGSLSMTLPSGAEDAALTAEVGARLTRAALDVLARISAPGGA